MVKESVTDTLAIIKCRFVLSLEPFYQKVLLYGIFGPNFHIETPLGSWYTGPNYWCLSVTRGKPPNGTIFGSKEQPSLAGLKTYILYGRLGEGHQS